MTHPTSVKMLSIWRTLLHRWSLRIQWESQAVGGAVADINLTPEESTACIQYCSSSLWIRYPPSVHQLQHRKEWTPFLINWLVFSVQYSTHYSTLFFCHLRTSRFSGSPVWIRFRGTINPLQVSRVSLKNNKLIINLKLLTDIQTQQLCY